MTFTANDIRSIKGFLNDAEAALLYKLASEVPAGGVIVEIGSYEGKSTVCLGKGAQVNGAWVYAVDPHADYQVDDSTHYGTEHHAALLKNLVDYGVADVVRVVALASAEICWKPEKDIALMFIDGDHEAKAVKEDFQLWSWYVPRTGLVAFHDYTNPRWPGVAQVVNEAIASGEWELVAEADATAVIKRVKPE